MNQTKPDLVITCIAGYRHWEQVRPFAISLMQSGFRGDKVILAAACDPFVIECLENRGFIIVPFSLPNPEGFEHYDFVVRNRFVPLLQFLAKHKNEYRNVLWVDAGDQIFQRNPSDWFDTHTVSDTRFLVAARECWLIKDELQFNDPWVKATCPSDYEWLRNMEVCCAGTIAGDAQTMFDAMSKIYAMVYDKPDATDQAAWNYIVHKPFEHPVPTKILIPKMSEGWTATCAPFKTDTFTSVMGRPESELLDKAPRFNEQTGLVMTPDGSKPMTLVHQYNRDGRWVKIMQEKYRWD